MSDEKYLKEAETLRRFFSIYCEDRHPQAQKTETVFTLKNGESALGGFTLKLCGECESLLRYAMARLNECPHEIKPRCRQCHNPCYEKEEWRKMAKLMRYSGVKLGMVKVKKKLKGLLSGRWLNA